MKQQKEMTLIKYSLLLLLLVFSCQGTHGKIVEYHAPTSMAHMHDEIMELSKNKKIEVIDSTDYSGLNRPGYMDIKLLKTNLFEETIFQIHFRGDEELWLRQKNKCIFSIIKINGKINSKLGFFSKTKREGVKAFNEYIIPLLEERVGKIK